MKIIISIPLILLLFFSGISVKFATHYCGGYVAATKVSLTGELATCGMEGPSVNNSSQGTYNNNCCDDVTSSYSICNNYIPSSYSFDDQGQQVIKIIFAPSDFISNLDTTIFFSNNTIRPPGTNHPNSVDRQVLCIFRI